jgi:replicative DNA helicase
MIDDLIIAGLLFDEKYSRKVAPHVQKEYFSDQAKKEIFAIAVNHFLKFNTLVSKEILKIELENAKSIAASEYERANKYIEEISYSEQNLDWMVEQTEKFCKDRSIYNAIMDSISIIDGSDKKRTVEVLPKLLQDALSVTFDTEVGHSYIDDAERRFDAYSAEESRIPFDLDVLNTITRGGLPNKTLSVILAQSGGGKSLIMSHMSAGFLKSNKNVLYITLEMAEEKIAERIDANLLDVEIDKLESLGKDRFMNKITAIKEKTTGRLFVKEFPSGRAHSGHFRALINELKVKQNFVPDVIFVDYLGICASSSVKLSGSINTYTYLKHVAEELRALSMEFDLPIVTAGQVNRNGYNNSDLDLTDISDSLGIVMAADLILGVVRTETLDSLDQIMFVQMKNRHSDPSAMKRFLVGIDRSKMKLHDLGSDNATCGIMKEPELNKINNAKLPTGLQLLNEKRGPGANFSEFTYT